jgi:hypothetical protein
MMRRKARRAPLVAAILRDPQHRRERKFIVAT